MQDFHAHVYFSAETRASALQLRAALTEQTPWQLQLGRVHDGPVGPHTVPSYQILIPPALFTDVVFWLMCHHGSHAVLIHPNTGDDVRDHTDHALWLGERLPLNLAALA